METYDVKTFNQKMRTRTKAFAVSVYTMLKRIRLDDLNRVVVRQLMKSASSVAANYNSATLSFSSLRSKNFSLIDFATSLLRYFATYVKNKPQYRPL
jgi:hypothetical protein